MKNIKGFTLSEVMITLGILGVLAAILIPAVMNVAPDNNKVMFKKAYYTTEKVVSSLISDDALYPLGSPVDIGGGVMGYVGFNDKTSGSGPVFPVGSNKFCYLFSQRVNTVGNVNCSTAPFTFATTDGMIWTFSDSPFTVNNTAYTSDNVLSVDVNGGKTPGCFYNVTTCANPDQFRFRIRYDGKMTIDSSDDYAVKILSNPTNNKK